MVWIQTAARDIVEPMSLEVNRRLTGGVTILDLIGNVTAGAEADVLRTHIMDAFQQSSKHILLNCEQLDYADSSGIGEILRAYASIARDGGMMKLLRPHRRILELLAITHLDKVFEVIDDERLAVGSFNTASQLKNQQTMTAFLKD